MGDHKLFNVSQCFPARPNFDDIVQSKIIISLNSAAVTAWFVGRFHSIAIHGPPNRWPAINGFDASDPTRSANKMSECVNDLFVRFIMAATTYRAFVTLASKSVVVAATINGAFYFLLPSLGRFLARSYRETTPDDVFIGHTLLPVLLP